MIAAILRRLVGAKPRYAKERARLRAAISNGQIDPGQPLPTAGRSVNRIIGWNSFFDGGDWVELEMEAEERRMTIKSVSDFLRLLDAIDGSPPSPDE